ncbi:hypothetical protein BDQ94DRAFT_148092 [Aspergillus welwitschiae]|uniref:Uncharacterized protein n=1 Tax=Aspergillus welwitschiae TaxID=1341132 RepID=A0A3F3PVF7_9EURO|nr:hypothetical protein BDQ94DRAFT_148092 [Aspergillus welwitschiae]RDH30855.1 hypothetical protein BDQ94DRAFT_148092 [Aspergillus welwitschiae]
MEEGRLPFICRKSFSATRRPTAPNICSSEAGSLIDRFVLVSALHELTEGGLSFRLGQLRRKSIRYTSLQGLRDMTRNQSAK